MKDYTGAIVARYFCQLVLVLVIIWLAVNKSLWWLLLLLILG